MINKSPIVFMDDRDFIDRKVIKRSEDEIIAVANSIDH